MRRIMKILLGIAVFSLVSSFILLAIVVSLANATSGWALDIEIAALWALAPLPVVFSGSVIAAGVICFFPNYDLERKKK